MVERTSGAEGGEPLALPGSRQQRLMDILLANGQVTVSELTALFNVSRDTIRRDLYLLEKRGLLRRIHGGAVPVDGLVARQTKFQSRMMAHIDAKRRIARGAAALIRDGETMILNGGSTTSCFAAELGSLRDVTLVTNNMFLPAMVPQGVARAIYVLGGVYWESAQVTIGAVSFPSTAQISVDTAIISSTGITVDGLSISRLEEATVTAAMMAVARRTIVLVDSSKFGNGAFAVVAPLSHIHCLVTDAPPPDDIGRVLEQANVRVVVCAPDF